MRTSTLFITHHEITPGSLSKVISGKSPARVGFRIAIIQSIMDGVPVQDLSRRHSISRYGIYKLIRRVNKYGLQGLYEAEHTGRKSLLTDSLKKKILKLRKTSPVDFGYSQSSWNGRLLRKYLKENEGVDIGHSQINVWIHKLNFHLQRGNKRHEKIGRKNTQK